MRASSRFGRHQAPDAVEVYRRVVDAVLQTCHAAGGGDLEARMAPVDGSEAVPELLAVRAALNLLLDRTDFYVRDSAATLLAASRGEFHRRFLLGGATGAFRSGAITINNASSEMATAQADVDQAAARRLSLADSLEQTVAAVAEQLAAASVELSATAAGLCETAGAAVTEADRAGATVGELETASGEIQEVIGVISKIAAQTKLLALNATIEAARAGEVGRGFAVVADEVKTLADSTASSAARITGQVVAMQEVAAASTTAMGSVGENVREMSPVIEAVWSAVDSTHGSRAGGGDATGLTQMAEVLRAEVDTFLAELRSG